MLRMGVGVSFLTLSVPISQGERASEYLSQLIQRDREGVAALKRAIRSDSAFRNLLTYVIWPREISSGSHTFEMAAKLRRKREVSPDGEGKSGTFFSQKMGREVQYESLMELQFLLKLEQIKEIALYQEQPFVIPYELDGISRTYYPDVFFVVEDGRGVVVEIKHRYQMALHENLTKLSALRKFCVQNGWGLLVTDGTRPIQQLQQYEFAVEFQTALLTALANSQDGTLSWKEYKSIRDQYNATWDDFTAIILRNRLIWNLQPFELKQRIPNSPKGLYTVEVVGIDY